MQLYSALPEDLSLATSLASKYCRKHHHVGDIEHTGVSAHLVMFVDLGTVINGHLPAGKINDFATVLQVFIEQGGFLAHGQTPLITMYLPLCPET
jgi:hypothetical protein